MRLRPATEADAQTRRGPRDRRRHRRDGRGRLQRSRTCTTSGASPASTCDQDAVVVEDDAGTMIGYAHFRGGDLLAVVDPRARGRGRRHRAARVGRAARPRARRRRKLRQGIGDRGASARALLEAHGYARRAQLLAARARRRRRRRRSRPACAPLTPEDAPALYAIHEAAFAARPDHTPPQRGGLDPARVRRPRRSTTSLSRVAERPAASRSPAAGRTTPPTSRCSAVHPDHAGQGLGTRCCRPCSPPRRRRAAPGRPQRRLRQPERRCASTSASA